MRLLGLLGAESGGIMTKRRNARSLEFAKLARDQFMANNPGLPPDCAFFAGFALALGYTRLVGVPNAAEQEAVSAEALRLSIKAED
jgi:hypothetical protein